MSFHSNLVQADIVSAFRSGLESRKYTVCAKDGKLWNTSELQGDKEATTETPWLYINNPPDFHCGWSRDITSVFGFITTRCLGCWKVVVRPNNIVELFALMALMYEMAEKDPTCYCKCGIERRDTVHGNYGGYFYNPTKEAMQERYMQVKELIHTRINSNIEIIPKRYCTELELEFGPSDKYEQPEGAKKWEEIIASTCHMEEFPYKQPDIVKNAIMRLWIKHAWSVGDPSVVALTDGQPLVPPVVKYYPEEDQQE